MQEILVNNLMLCVWSGRGRGGGGVLKREETEGGFKIKETAG